MKRAFSDERLVRTARCVLCALAALCLSGCTARMVRPARPLSEDFVPQSVAVSSFDDRSGFSGPWQLSSGMADLLVSELVGSRNFAVVERTHLDKIVGEIQRQRNKLFRREDRVREGRLKNARYLIRGVINDFSQVGGGSLALALRNVLFGGRGHRARVSLTLTIVEVETGVIVDSVQAAGICRAREAYAAARYKHIAFGGDAFFKTPLGIATVNAIRTGVRRISESMPHIEWQPMLAQVMADGRLVLNGGSRRGYRVGQVYDVHTEGRIVTDPATGDTLDVAPGPIVGRIRVIEVSPAIAYAESINGVDFERGQYLVPVKAAAAAAARDERPAAAEPPARHDDEAVRRRGFRFF